jgi:two-component system chemotaxis response regulator CheB
VRDHGNANEVTGRASIPGATTEFTDSAPVPHFDVVVVAASAGGISALSKLFSGLPADLPVPLVVVQHLDPRHRSLLAEVLARRTRLHVRQVRDGEKLEAGTIYIAPPDNHVLANSDGTIALSHSELVHFVRPSADLLFESAAGAYRDRVIAVVLTGTGSDGNMGVRAVKAVKGTVIAQDPADAEFDGMPKAAVSTGDVDFVLPLDEIPNALVTLIIGENG